MADAFLSYSHLDAPFVDKLAKALSDAGVTVWVDRNDIPAAAPWKRVADRGVNAADNFVIVLSPGWQASIPCKGELEQAIIGGKRLIPLSLGGVPSASIDERFRGLNYIHFDPETDFAQQVKVLVDALRTDLSWIEDHTRLLERATDWRDHKNDESRLLRGQDLRDAELWQEQSAGSAQPPTPLHRDYIFESRKAAVARQKTRLKIAWGVGVVLFGLALFAGVQWRRAVSELHFEESARLAEDALHVAPEHFDLAVLLSVEASKRGDTYDARNAEVTLWQSQPHLVRFEPAKAGDDQQFFELVSTLPVIDPLQPGRVLAFNPDGTFHDVDPRTQQTVSPIDPLRLTTLNHLVKPLVEKRAYDPVAGTFSADGSHFALGIGSKFWIVDLNTQTVSGPVDVQSMPRTTSMFCKCTAAMLQFNFSPNGRWIAATTNDIRFGIWSVGSLEPLSDLITEIAYPGGPIAWLPDNTLVVGGRVWSPDTLRGERILAPAAFVGSNQIQEVAFRPDGKSFVTGDTGHIGLWGVGTGIERVVPLDWLGNHWGQLSHDVLTADASSVIEPADGQEVRIRRWNVASNARLADLVDPSRFSDEHFILPAFAVSSTGLIAEAGNAGVRIWNPAVSGNARLMPSFQGERVGDLTFSPESKVLATLGSPNEGHCMLRLWRLSDGIQTRSWPVTGECSFSRNLMFSPDGTMIGLRTPEGVTLWTARTGEQVMKAEARQTARFRFTPDGRELILRDGNLGVAVWDLAAKRILGQRMRPYSFALDLYDETHGLATSPDGTLIASGYQHGQLRLWQNISYMDWTREACRIAGRNLTLAEWQQYQGAKPYRKTCPDLPAQP